MTESSDMKAAPPLEARDRMRRCVFVATDRLQFGAAATRYPGELVPEAQGWARAFIDVTHARRLVALSPEACAAIVRSALAVDSTLAADIVRAARSNLR